MSIAQLGLSLGESQNASSVRIRLPDSQLVQEVAQVPVGGSEYLPAAQATQVTPESQVPPPQWGVGSGDGSGDG